MEGIAATIKQFILDEFLPGEDPANLTMATPLIRGGILNSMATLRLVSFLEETYGVSFAPHEMGTDRIGTITDIVTLVESKLR